MPALRARWHFAHAGVVAEAQAHQQIVEHGGDGVREKQFHRLMAYSFKVGRAYQIGSHCREIVNHKLVV